MPRILHPGSDPNRFSLLIPPGRLWLAFLSAPLLLAATQLSAQQPGYAPYGQPQYGYGYGSQSPQPGYAQPQYAQPQFGQQPQYGQQEPYAGPQPNETYGAQPYPEQPYAGQPDAGYAQPQQPTQPPLSPDQLEQLVAPIALYPDALLAQILTASTYPAQVAVANQWLQQMQAQGYGSPDQVAAGANAQDWDPSVKALTAFPQVLETMDHNLQWTTQLGNAYFNQPQDLMQTVQVLRQRAESAGTLQSTPQETVSENQGAIELAPPSPETVYVPSYDPWGAYGAPIAPYPGFSFVDALGSFFGTGLRFGAGIAMNAFDQTPFGWIGWGLSWLAHAVFFHHSTYFTNSPTVADWGFPHGGPRAYGGGWGRGYGRYARPGEFARSREFARPNYARGAVARAPQNYGGYGHQNAYDRASPYARGGDAFASNRAYGRESQYGSSAYASPRYNYGRAPQQAYNRPTPTFSHPQTYGSSVYGRSAYGYEGHQNYTAPARSYASPYNSYRAPQSYQRAYAQPPSRSFAQPSRGFFSHGSGNENFGGGRAPKGYSGGHSFFGGHSSHGYKAPRGGGEHFKAPKSGGGHRHR